MAYWNLTHATDQISAGRRGQPRALKPSDLRRILSRPATLGDITEAWMLTHPKQNKSEVRRSRSSIAGKMKKTGSTDAGIDWFLNGDLDG